MEVVNLSPTDLLKSAGHVLLIEAAPGEARRDYLRQALQAVQSDRAATRLLICDRATDGLWAGLKDLFSDLIPTLQAYAPDLIVKYSYELAVILPALQRTIKVQNPNLTDLSPEAERTRNYAADRAYRIIHGLIDLLDAWQQISLPERILIACDRYDHASGMVQRFFTELMRRRGQRLQITLILAVDHDAGEPIRRLFTPASIGQRLHLNLPPDSTPPVSPDHMAQRAHELQQRIAGDPIELELHLPRLIHYWLLSDQPERVLFPQLYAFTIYTTRGFYEDALVYGEATLALLERYRPDDLDTRFNIYLKLYNCYVAIDRPLEALTVAEAAMARTDDPGYLFPWCYMMAMLYTRFLPKRDLSKAEAYLERGLTLIARADLPKHTRLFQTAFNRNGLALIRHQQKQPEEAIRLCQSSFDDLNKHLEPHEHLLHRSVLLYNIAQVYAITGPYEQAIAYFSATMDMDPNYSEYYNERGNVYLKMDRLEEARRDYHKAIDLSPPYMEVWTNLGQCYQLMGRLDEAINAYTHAIDLDPTRALPFSGRAEAFEGLGHPDLALIDYSAALDLQPNQPQALANRAILYYDAGQLQEALADLDRAIALSPEIPELYQNRAVALIDLQRFDQAASDLQTYLRLCPDAADRAEVEDKLSQLLEVHAEEMIR